MSVLNGPCDGTWSVFAEKVVEERDALRDEVSSLTSKIEQLRRELAAVGATTAPLYTSQEREQLITQRDEAREAHEELLTEVDGYSLMAVKASAACSTAQAELTALKETSERIISEAEVRGAQWALDRCDVPASLRDLRGGAAVEICRIARARGVL